MMKISKWWILVFFFMQGCTNCFNISKSGTEIDTYAVDKVVIGETTKADVIAFFGIPDQVISRKGSSINIRESTNKRRSRSTSDRTSGHVSKKTWGTSTGAGQRNASSKNESKTISMSTPASAIASQGDVFEYRRVTEKTLNCFRIGTYESSTAATLTVVFDTNDIVQSFSYRD